jgi:small subunit ribosomal protein S6
VWTSAAGGPSATGRGAPAGTCGGLGASRGQATTSASAPSAAANRATFRHRIRRCQGVIDMPPVGAREAKFAPIPPAKVPRAMAPPPPLYDLVLLLDSEASDEQRTKVLDDAVRVIGQHGEVVSDEDWGLRALAFEIRHKSEAQYHLLQFHASREALEELNRMLHIADGVVRYRIIKLKPGTAPSSAAAAVEEPEPVEAAP